MADFGIVMVYVTICYIYIWYSNNVCNNFFYLINSFCNLSNNFYYLNNKFCNLLRKKQIINEGKKTMVHYCLTSHIPFQTLFLGW